jgi:hypothetical protein
MRRLLEAIGNGLLAFAAYIAVVVVSSVAADYTYYRQTRAEQRLELSSGTEPGSIYE